MQISRSLPLAIKVVPLLQLQAWCIWQLLKSIVQVRSYVQKPTIASDGIEVLVVVVFSIFLEVVERIADGVRIAPAVRETEIA